MPHTEHLTRQEVMRLTGIRSRTTIWRRSQTGRFASPVDIGSGRIRGMSQPRMAARKRNGRQSQYRPDDDQMTRAMISSATRSTGPKEQVTND